MPAATTAHILRRLTLGPTADALLAQADDDPMVVIRRLLDAEPDLTDPPQLDNDDFDSATRWWMSLLRDERGGLHERMSWFWHGHLTSSLDKSSPSMMATQIGLLRRHALGNFRTMLREITLDPAMLRWLDGDGSQGDAPNENFARELLELFALGRDSGAYTENDVRAAARALAGWWIDETDDGAVTVRLDTEAVHGRPVTFLGRQVRDVDDVIDAVCDHPACARHVARAVHEHLVGGPPDESRLDALADGFRTRGLEIAPLVEDIVTHPSFLAAPPRPRSSLEWFLACERFYDVEFEIWLLESMGQMPLSPPNVAGWPGTDRWVSSGVLLDKAQTALDMVWDTATLDQEDPIGDAVRRAALPDISETTRAVLQQIVDTTEGRRDVSSLLHAAIALCPEFSHA